MKGINRSELEEYFSSDLLQVKVDDNLARHEKIQYIHKYSPDILQNLRICCKWNSDGGLNCNKCEKCLRTILICNMLGLSELTTFPKLALKDINKLYNNYSITLKKTNDRYTYLRQLNDLYSVFIKNYKIGYNFYRGDKLLKYNKTQFCSINANRCIFVFQNELERLFENDTDFIYNNEVFDYSNYDDTSSVANTLYYFDIHQITHKMLFAHHFKNKPYRPLTYIISTNDTTIYKKYCDCTKKNQLNQHTDLKYTDKYTWFCKPPGLSAGKGIVITQNPGRLYNNPRRLYNEFL